MRFVPTAAVVLAAVATFFISRSAAAAIPTFKVDEIDKSLSIGYAVSLVDLNGDGKPDIVVVDKDRVIWFENPTWQLHTILQGQTALDNVCLDAIDINGDGKPDIVLGAGWKGTNTKDESTVQWLSRGADVN